MWKSQTRSYDALRARLDTLPVIETHEHWCGVCPPDENLDLLALLAGGGYYASDLASASADFAKRARPGLFPISPLAEYLTDTRHHSFDQRYAAWRTYHERTCHTAYTRGLFEGLRACWGLESIEKKAMLAAQERMQAERNQACADRTLARHGIQTMIVNTDLTAVMAGSLPYRKGFARFVLDLPQYHALSGEGSVRKPHLEAALNRRIVTLDDYLEAFERFLEQAIQFGIVGIKDQSAYHRCIAYANPPRAEAETVFNRIVAHPRDSLGTDQVRPLDDYLFNQFMRLAARRGLPVQVHTGHMAGICNEITKTNPAHLTAMLELHSEVQFDLFHGGWPYLGEYLFLGKNHPNVTLDMCWANAIEPLYSVEFFKRALQTVPHSKIHGYGGDTHLFECAVGYLILARDNLAAALAEMVDAGWLGTDEALAVARAWLFDNPNRTFRLDCQPGRQPTPARGGRKPRTA